MTDRREFMASATTALGALALADWLRAELPTLGARAAPRSLAEDEKFWARLRRSYDLHPHIVNLDHGWTSPAPRSAVDAVVRGARDLQSIPADRLARLWSEITTRPSAKRSPPRWACRAPISRSWERHRSARTPCSSACRSVRATRSSARRTTTTRCSTHQAGRARRGRAQMLRPRCPASRSMRSQRDGTRRRSGRGPGSCCSPIRATSTGQLLPVRRIAAAAHAWARRSSWM